MAYIISDIFQHIIMVYNNKFQQIESIKTSIANIFRCSRSAYLNWLEKENRMGIQISQDN